MPGSPPRTISRSLAPVVAGRLGAWLLTLVNPRGNGLVTARVPLLVAVTYLRGSRRETPAESAARMNAYTQLVIETAANRLVLRALLASLFASGGDQGQRLAKAVIAATEALAPKALHLDGLDISTQVETSDQLRKRAMALLAELSNA